jgi:hypothetical protein
LSFAQQQIQPVHAITASGKRRNPPKDAHNVTKEQDE